ncbi:hypothetical protein N9J72_02410 [Candidatus Gracilibacteria bacterium]|nr:hypothetical protein [Candidatus Gracilibacteria bacterium]
MGINNIGEKIIGGILAGTILSSPLQAQENPDLIPQSEIPGISLRGDFETQPFRKLPSYANNIVVRMCDSFGKILEPVGPGKQRCKQCHEKPLSDPENAERRMTDAQAFLGEFSAVDHGDYSIDGRKLDILLFQHRVNGMTCLLIDGNEWSNRLEITELQLATSREINDYLGSLTRGN